MIPLSPPTTFKTCSVRPNNTMLWSDLCVCARRYFNWSAW